MGRLILLGLPIMEFIGILVAVDWAGLGWTLLALALGAVAGIAVIRLLGAASLRHVQAALVRQEPPAGPALDGLVALTAGVLLIIPGFLSDLAALGLLVAPVRRLVMRSVWRRVGKGRNSPASPPVAPKAGQGPSTGSAPGGIIEGHYERLD